MISITEIDESEPIKKHKNISFVFRKETMVFCIILSSIGTNVIFIVESDGDSPKIII